MLKILFIEFSDLMGNIALKMKEKGHEVVVAEKCNPKKASKIFDKVVIWHEGKQGGEEIVKEFHNQGKKVILLQHGYKGLCGNHEPEVYELKSDAVCVWGEKMKDRINNLSDKSKIFITGCWLNELILPRVKQEGINIVYFPAHFKTELDENILTAIELKKLNASVVSKILSCHKAEFYPTPIISDRSKKYHLSTVLQLLSVADLVVGTFEGTPEMLAQVMDIPVVISNIWRSQDKMSVAVGEKVWDFYHRDIDKGCAVVKGLKDLNKTILQELKNPQRLSKERKEVAINEAGVNIKNPLEEIIKVIEEI
ncbi:MAG: hypothetical protein A2163_07165 [Actinobacteria bacterium RBG_13_35_12]|nr:MAG: hypothetical protein A2163_07165 [Actinobacteria bacterium RBG_13_35_12]